MPNRTCTAKAICPFYLSADKKGITCEGIIPHTCIVSRFRSSAARDDYQIAHCDTYDYASNCPIAILIMRSWDDGKNN